MVSEEALKKLQEQIAAWPMTQRFVVQQLIEDYSNIRKDLLAYKNTGLTPESVEALKLSMMGKTIAEIKEFNGLPVDRLRELAEADKDGQLVVLPCKVGDTVIDQTFAENPRLMKNTRLEIAYESRCGIIFHMGYDIFADLVEHGRIKPVSEEAKKALEARKND
jgi:hypothetical protein